jgi:hypothetical protein
MAARDEDRAGQRALVVLVGLAHVEHDFAPLRSSQLLDKTYCLGQQLSEL